MCIHLSPLYSERMDQIDKSIFCVSRCVPPPTVGVILLLEEPCGAGLHSWTFLCPGCHGAGHGWWHWSWSKHRLSWRRTSGLPALGGQGGEAATGSLSVCFRGGSNTMLEIGEFWPAGIFVWLVLGIFIWSSVGLVFIFNSDHIFQVNKQGTPKYAFN